MRKLLVLIPLLFLIILLSAACVTQEASSPPTPSASFTTPTTLPVLITTSTPAPFLERSATIARDNYVSWELSFASGKRYAVDVVTDSAPIDLLVVDLANYQKFSIAFTSNSGSPWEEYVILTPGIVQKRVEFKSPRSGKYRIVIENSDYIPGGAMTTRDVSVTVHVFALD